MRFTVTFDPDVAKDLKKLMSKNQLKFKDAANRKLLRGLIALEAAEKAEKPRAIGGSKQ
jgi:mRNA-degrading endonuclease RelE of RelBE toxin-antitoxin system